MNPVIVKMPSGHKKITLISAQANTGKTNYVIEEVLHELSEDRRVMFLSNDMLPCELAKRTLEISKGKPCEELVKVALQNGYLKFKPLPSAGEMNMIDKMVQKERPDVLVIDHYVGFKLTSFLESLNMMLEQECIEAFVTIQSKKS